MAVVTASTLLTVAASAPVADIKPGGESLLALVDFAAQRVQIADAVAAAKWGTDASINDPVREKAVVDSAAIKSTHLAIDPAVSIEVFTDQIEANKAVQYALYSRWSAHSDQVPTTRSDLGRIRPILDQITDGLLTQLKATQEVRAHRRCAIQLATARHHVKQARAFDLIHDDALGRALVSVCHRAQFATDGTR
jgi:chorismate mutase